MSHDFVASISTCAPFTKETLNTFHNAYYNKGSSEHETVVSSAVIEVIRKCTSFLSGVVDVAMLPAPSNSKNNAAKACNRKSRMDKKEVLGKVDLSRVRYDRLNKGSSKCDSVFTYLGTPFNIFYCSARSSVVGVKTRCCTGCCFYCFSVTSLCDSNGIVRSLCVLLVRVRGTCTLFLFTICCLTDDKYGRAAAVCPFIH
jgi:hypothetical protein